MVTIITKNLLNYEKVDLNNPFYKQKHSSKRFEP